jgi:transcriptional regulator with XRE-family HTH domain
MAALSLLAAEFSRLMKRLRWNQSETARALFVTPAHINQIVNGKAEPSAAMLQLLKLTAAQRRPELAAQLLSPAARPTPEPDALEEFWAALRRRKLDRLPPAEQAEFVAAWGKILGVSAGKQRQS